MESTPTPPWLFFMFQLPARQASRRVSVWRRLKAAGALGWRNSAYILPNTPENLERLQWLAREIEKNSGEASVVVVQQIEGEPDATLLAAFNEQRGREYERLTKLVMAVARRRRPAPKRAEWARFERQYDQIAAVDYFQCPKRTEAEAGLRDLERRLGEMEGVAGPKGASGGAARVHKKYRGRMWMTRPRPEIDRVASAWLIRTFIDPEAKFVFGGAVGQHPEAIAFDMFDGAFTHDGDRCTFEVLQRRFAPRDQRLAAIAAMVHDADLGDDKFHRTEGMALQQVFRGWGRLEWSDEEILRQGFLLMNGLYTSLQKTPLRRTR